MKKTLLALILLAPGLALAKDASVTFSIPGWHCGGCASKTEASLKKVKGVKTVSSDVSSHKLVIAFDDSVTSEKALRDAIKDAGYEADGSAKKN